MNQNLYNIYIIWQIDRKISKCRGNELVKEVLQIKGWSVSTFAIGWILITWKQNYLISVVWIDQRYRANISVDQRHRANISVDQRYRANISVDQRHRANISVGACVCFSLWKRSTWDVFFLLLFFLFCFQELGTFYGTYLDLWTWDLFVV